MKILAIGIGADDFTKSLFEDIEFTMDTADLRPSPKQTGYDSVVVFNALNRVSYRLIKETLAAWLAAVKPGGELVILFHSLEWVARQVLYEDSPSPAMQAVLFGHQRNPKEYNQGAYTLLQMRDFCQAAGLKVTHVKTGVYDMAGHDTEMHTIRGVR